MTSNSRYAVGVDLGGTFIKAGVVDAQGRITPSSRISVDTGCEKGMQWIVASIADAAERAVEASGLAWDDVSGVGLGSPGVFDFDNGILIFAPNLICLNGQPLARLVKKELAYDTSVYLENDANCAGLGEQWAGIGRGAKNLVLFTLGTGIGGGVVLDGKLWHGSRGVGAELGHQVLFADGVKCGCGNRGCLEAYASATATVRRFHEAVKTGKPSALADKARAGAKVTSKMIHEAAVRGDVLSRDILEETGRFLGIAVVNMLNIVDPEIVCFSGGMTGAGDMLLNAIKDEAAKRACGPGLKGVSIVFGTLGNDAGLIGAAGCVFSKSGISA
jgi:glucokinase